MEIITENKRIALLATGLLISIMVLGYHFIKTDLPKSYEENLATNTHLYEQAKKVSSLDSSSLNTYRARAYQMSFGG